MALSVRADDLLYQLSPPPSPVAHVLSLNQLKVSVAFSVSFPGVLVGEEEEPSFFVASDFEPPLSLFLTQASHDVVGAGEGSPLDDVEFSDASNAN